MPYVALFISLLAFAGVFLQATTAKDIPSAFRTLRYYTIQTNLLVGVLLLLHFFARLKGPTLPAGLRLATGGVTVWILVTLGVFHWMLSALYQPVGVRRISNALMHYITPILMLGYFLMVMPSEVLDWTLLLWWSSYPMVYFAGSMIGGRISGFYPYWFLRPSGQYPEGNGSYPRVLLTVMVLFCVYLLLGLVLLYGKFLCEELFARLF
jgi:hypothetical protein